jgi:hypothetical protein
MDTVKECIKAAYDCSVACETCATQSLFGDVKSLARSIMLSRQCSIICIATANILSAGNTHFKNLCKACEELCAACAEECGKHADTYECKQCAYACRHCANLFRKMYN